MILSFPYVYTTNKWLSFKNNVSLIWTETAAIAVNSRTSRNPKFPVNRNPRRIVFFFTWPGGSFVHFSITITPFAQKTKKRTNERQTRPKKGPTVTNKWGPSLIRGDDNLIRDSHSSKEMETRSTCCHLSLSLSSHLVLIFMPTLALYLGSLMSVGSVAKERKWNGCI